MKDDILKVLLTEEELDKRVTEMGRQITEKLRGEEPLFVGVLKGSFVFMADLMRRVDLRCSVDFMAVSSCSDYRPQAGYPTAGGRIWRSNRMES